MTELMNWNYVGKCLYCQTSLYKKNGKVKAYPHNPTCSCQGRAICVRCEKDSTTDVEKWRDDKLIWMSTGLCRACYDIEKYGGD